MLRDKNLVPLSQQHHNALALCVYIERALKSGNPDVDHWQAEIQGRFKAEIGFHFEAEEKLLFPAAAQFAELVPLVQELLGEHRVLRGLVERAARRELGPEQLRAFSGILSGHVRKEERQLFEEMQRLLPAGEMALLGAVMLEYFRSCGMAGSSCAIPSSAVEPRA